MIESASKYWQETMAIPEARWIVILTILAILILIGVYVTMYFRGHAKGLGSEPADYLSDFRKLKDEGKLDEEEFGKLKRVIPKETEGETKHVSGLPSGSTETFENENGETGDKEGSDSYDHRTDLDEQVS